MLAQASEGVATYATAADYCSIFSEEMPSLYLLALLLTADKDKASQCFIQGLEHCTDRVGVFTERAGTWARRAIVKHAIRMITPNPEQTAAHLFVSAKRPEDMRSDAFAAITSLGAFERFVFVMSVLEGHSDGDCRCLLRCTQRELAMARELALTLVATASFV